ncbi:hypothetical protein LshimejAT787_1301900 [Lyophyllum shimeji]|uniref:Uncharacterized protein n=1 Tax=Lyophyllum shimeji TaxID=47721 RepID=A0A9P3PXH6_LYOSH|nr:hypothetical protein LshimejAT787_1301900 [Lyophyllum shimeji]
MAIAAPRADDWVNCRQAVNALYAIMASDCCRGTSGRPGSELSYSSRIHRYNRLLLLPPFGEYEVGLINRMRPVLRPKFRPSWPNQSTSQPQISKMLLHLLPSAR